MVKSAWTPPSRVRETELLPFTTKGKRASRTGPSAVMKEGMVLVAPLALAVAICGLGPMFG